jgi:hypothetical protein
MKLKRSILLQLNIISLEVESNNNLKHQQDNNLDKAPIITFVANVLAKRVAQHNEWRTFLIPQQLCISQFDHNTSNQLKLLGVGILRRLANYLTSSRIVARLLAVAAEPNARLTHSYTITTPRHFLAIPTTKSPVAHQNSRLLQTK